MLAPLPPAANVPVPAAAVPEPAPREAASTTVLVVEDEDVVRRLVRTVLSGAGFEVLVARDGEEAFALAAEHRVDVLLTDLMMPKLGGLEVAERLRATHPDLKVVFMSGYSETGMLDDGHMPPRNGVSREAVHLLGVDRERAGALGRLSVCLL